MIINNLILSTIIVNYWSFFYAVFFFWQLLCLLTFDNALGSVLLFCLFLFFVFCRFFILFWLCRKWKVSSLHCSIYCVSLCFLLLLLVFVCVLFLCFFFNIAVVVMNAKSIQTKKMKCGQMETSEKYIAYVVMCFFFM